MSRSLSLEQQLVRNQLESMYSRFKGAKALRKQAKEQFAEDVLDYIERKREVELDLYTEAFINRSKDAWKKLLKKEKIEYREPVFAELRMSLIEMAYIILPDRAKQ